ncbi:hypothetical protein, partial [Anaerotignum propionicum]|uniref:hypothetical protein n=1 Tax=Anaerotignum propionicum TaxID=28446 RepID=UPI00210BBC0F
VCFSPDALSIDTTLRLFFSAFVSNCEHPIACIIMVIIDMMNITYFRFFIRIYPFFLKCIEEFLKLLLLTI